MPYPPLVYAPAVRSLGMNSRYHFRAVWCTFRNPPGSNTSTGRENEVWAGERVGAARGGREQRREGLGALLPLLGEVGRFVLVGRLLGVTDEQHHFREGFVRLLRLVGLQKQGGGAGKSQAQEC